MTSDFFSPEKKKKTKYQQVLTIIDRLGETVKSTRFEFDLQNQQCYIFLTVINNVTYTINHWDDKS